MNTDVRERIERYIENTKLSPKITDNYCLRCDDIRVFLEELDKDWYRAMCLMFDYGRAKGYRRRRQRRGNERDHDHPGGGVLRE